MIPAEFVQPDEFCGLTGSRQRAVWRRWLDRIGVAGFGDSPAEAMYDFDQAWHQKLARRGYSPASGPAQARTA